MDSSSTRPRAPKASASSIRGGKTATTRSHDLDGRSVTGPVALVEVQGYVFAAYRWLAEVAAQYGDAAWAMRACAPLPTRSGAWSRIASGCRRRGTTPRLSTRRSGR